MKADNCINLWQNSATPIKKALVMNKQIILSLYVLTSLSASAQKRAFELEDVYRVKYVSSPAVSAQGQVAYGISWQDLRKQKS